jgi:hypothetical protein
MVKGKSPAAKAKPPAAAATKQRKANSILALIREILVC